MGLPQPVGYLYWYTTSIILFLLTLLNLLSIAVRHFSRPASKKVVDSLPTISSTPAEVFSVYSKSSETPARKLGALTRCGRTTIAALEKYFALTAIPLPRVQWWRKRRAARTLPTTEVTINLGYILGVLVLSFYGASWSPMVVGNQAAWIAVAQVPLIIALAGKNNLVAFLTGISYEKLNFLHRSAGNVALVGVWIHFICHVYLWGGISLAKLKTPLTTWGIVGTFSFSLLSIVSTRWVRHRFYEFFLITHIALVALTLAAFILHWRAVDVWIYPGIGLWVADRLFRMLRVFVLNKLYKMPFTPVAKAVSAQNLPSTCSLTLLTPSTLLVSFPNPSNHLTWAAGQHFYLIMPGMSRLPWEAHPFTVATIPKVVGEDETTGELTFIVRVRDGFTSKMKDHVDTVRKERGLAIDDVCQVHVKAAVEGPYGAVRTMEMNDAVLLIAGGSGISFAIAHLLQIIRDAKQGNSRVRHCRIIWMVKSRLHLNWISPILLQHIHSIPTSLHVSLHIHVTKHYHPRGLSISQEPLQTLPSDPAMTDETWSDVLAHKLRTQRQGSVGRVKRMMSTFSWATFNSSSDKGGRSQPGTRRGSTMVWSDSEKTLKSNKSSNQTLRVEVEDTDLEKGKLALAPPIPTFSWSEGYGDSTIPGGNKAADSKEIDPMTRTKRLASEQPSLAGLSEDGDGSKDGEDDPYYPSPSARLSVQLVTPPRARQPSITIDEPASPRRGSRFSVSDMVDPVGRRGSSPTNLQIKASPRRGSRLNESYEPNAEIEGSPLAPAPILLPASPRAAPLTDDGLPSMRRTSIVSPQPRHLATSTSMLAPLAGGAPMAPSTSVQSNLTVMSQISMPELPSGAATPAVDETGAMDFKAEIMARRRQSIGLEQLVIWREGRADLNEVLKEMKADMRKGGNLSVNCCGPRSLLDSTRDCVKHLINVKEAWKGESVVEFTAETFGW
ncbi:hypothetical protein P7C73_g3519, partial [Tremellales sp. Uapishka_1]